MDGWMDGWMGGLVDAGGICFFNNVTVISGWSKAGCEGSAQWRDIKALMNDECNYGKCRNLSQSEMSRSTTKPTKWPVHPAKTQISLGIHPVWSESSLSKGSKPPIECKGKTLIKLGTQVILLVLSCFRSIEIAPWRAVSCLLLPAMAKVKAIVHLQYWCTWSEESVYQIWTLVQLWFAINELDFKGGCLAGCWQMHRQTESWALLLHHTEAAVKQSDKF